MLGEPHQVAIPEVRLLTATTRGEGRVAASSRERGPPFRRFASPLVAIRM